MLGLAHLPQLKASGSDFTQKYMEPLELPLSPSLELPSLMKSMLNQRKIPKMDLIFTLHLIIPTPLIGSVNLNQIMLITYGIN